MNKKGQANMFQLIVVIVLGVAAALTIFVDLGVDSQQIQTDYKEQLTATTFNQSFILDHPKLIDGSITIQNATNGTAALPNKLRDDQEFILNERTGQITLVNRSGVFNATYNYKPAAYAEKSSTRTILRLLPVIFAIVLMIFIGKSMIGNE